MTIFRGPGGTGSASSDSDTTEFQEFLVQSQAARDAAQAAQAAAEAAEAGAEAAAGDVDAGVAASAASATAAAGSASSAATSATAAAASAASAATQAGTAGVYAANAASAASAAASSMSAANTSATNAAASATASAASATNSANSATASSASATNAATSATNAGVYAAQSATSSSEAATSAIAANTSANNAGVSASSAAGSASSSAASAAAAALALDNFDDRYLGVKTAAPTLDNDGNALVAGALYFNSGAVTPADKGMWVYDGGTWIAASAASQSILVTYEYVATAGQTTFTGADANGASLSYTAGSIIVTLNGVKLRPGNDYTATNGNSVVLGVAAAAGDELVVDAFSTFDIANTYTQAQVDSALATKAPTTNPTFSGNVTLGSSVLATPTGSAPSYTCRAWVNFNGTGTVAIRASGNVSSITDLGVGAYRVNFATALPDVNFSAVAAGYASGDNMITTTRDFATNSAVITTVNGPGAGAGISFNREDTALISFAVFR